MNVSDNPNPVQQQQKQQLVTYLGGYSTEYTHQTFQTWLDLLVDVNSNDETKLKAITDLSLNLEVFFPLFCIHL